MPKKPKEPTPPDARGPLLSVAGSENAPLISFDGAPTFGATNGVLQITLEAVRYYPGEPGAPVVHDRVVVAHLRMTMVAAQLLKRALDGALLLAAPTETGAAN